MSNPFDEFTVESSSSNPFDSFDYSPALRKDEQDLVSVSNNDNTPTPENFSITKISSDFAKGMASDLLSFPQTIGGSLVQVGESSTAAVDGGVYETLKRSFSESLISSYTSETAGPLALAGATLSAARDVSVSIATPKAVIDSGKRLIDSNKELLSELNLTGEGVVFDIGTGLSSVMKSVGMTAITKNPSWAAAYMGWLTNSSDYMEARAAGKTPEEATQAAAISATGQAAVESFGGKLFLHVAQASSFFKKVLLRAIGQGAEESTQAIVEETVKSEYGIRDKSMEQIAIDVAYQGAIGLIVGAPVSAVASAMEKKAAEVGVSESEAQRIIKGVTENKEKIVDAAASLLDREAEGVVTPDVKSVKEIMQAYLAEDAGKEVDNPRVAARMILNQNVDQQVKTQIEELLKRPDVTMEDVKNVMDKYLAREDVKDSTLPPLAPEEIGKQFTGVRQVSINDVTIPEDEKELRKVIPYGENKDAPIGVTVRDGKFVVSSGVDKLIAAQKRGDDKVEIAYVGDVAGVKSKVINDLLDVKAKQIKEALRPKKFSIPSDVATKYSEFVKGEMARPKPKADIKGKLSSVSSAVGKALSPISTRLKNINPKLEAKLRKFEFDKNRRIAEDSAAVAPFIQKFQSLPDEARIILDYAMKNGDVDSINAIAKQNGMEADVKAVRDTLEQIYARAAKVNVDIGYRENYFPRIVSEPKKLLAHFRGMEEWSDIDVAIKKKQDEIGRFLTDDEKAHLVNSLLRGFGRSKISLSKEGATKERKVREVTPEINEFYESSDQALLRYVTNINESIEARKFFGKETENLDDSIASFVISEMEAGRLDPAKSDELSSILKARFNQGSMNPLLKAYKNFSYIDTMGSPISAITQLGGLSYSVANNGFFRTMASLNVGKEELSLKDIGIENIAQEFIESGKMASTVKTVFKLSGLDALDKFDKLVFINSTLKRLRAESKKPSKSFKNSLDNIFGEEAESVMNDLKAGRNSENVKLLIFNELSNMQPISLAEMPEMYLSNPNGRIFYMLKTFTIKQFDIYRRQIFSEIASGNVVTGLKNLTRFVSFFVLMQAGADFLKDLILGREVEPEDAVVTNIARVFGFSKYQVYSVKREGIGTAAFKTIAPPFKAIDSLSKDMSKAIEDGEVDLDELETVQSIPIVGKFYYWWFGSGSDK